jgi:hypothetical protein
MCDLTVTLRSIPRLLTSIGLPVHHHRVHLVWLLNLIPLPGTFEKSLWCDHRQVNLQNKPHTLYKHTQNNPSANTEELRHIFERRKTLLSKVPGR